MTAPGWYKDAAEPDKARWHDGTDWTDHTVVMADWQGRGTPPPPEMQPAFSAAPPPRSSRGEAKADAASAKARAKAMRPWYKKKRILIPLALLAIIVVSVAANSSNDTKINPGAVDALGTGNGEDSRSSELDDVTVTGCKTELGFVTASLTIVNNSSKMSDYLISVNILDSDGAKVGDASTFLDHLAPGQTAKKDAVDVVPGGTTGDLTCQVGTVDRSASS